MVLSVTRLSIDDARVLLEGAAMKSAEIGVPMCTAVCDESGLLLAFERAKAYLHRELFPIFAYRREIEAGPHRAHRRISQIARTVA